MKKTLMIIGSVLVGVLLLAGSFVGGMAFQRFQLTRTRANFIGGRNGANGAAGAVPGGNGQAAGGLGGFTLGQVKSYDGKTLMLSTARDVTTVNFDDSTRIQKAAQASTEELKPGERVIVTGQRDTSGAVTASQVIIISNP